MSESDNRKMILKRVIIGFELGNWLKHWILTEDNIIEHDLNYLLWI